MSTLLVALPLSIAAFLIWLNRAGPQKVADTLRRTVVPGVALLIFLLLAVRGGASALFLLMMLAPVLQRMWQSRNQVGQNWRYQGKKSRQSSVSTRFLKMTLNHDSGTLVGEVISGSFVGRSLSSLNQQELMALWRECANDSQSKALLESYFERTQDRDWRQRADDNREQHRSTNHGNLDEQEAWDILGLPPGASISEIRAAHRRLMQKHHPDHGGSTYFAARINQAKDLLLKKKG